MVFAAFLSILFHHKTLRHCGLDFSLWGEGGPCVQDPLSPKTDSAYRTQKGMTLQNSVCRLDGRMASFSACRSFSRHCTQNGKISLKCRVNRGDCSCQTGPAQPLQGLGKSVFYPLPFLNPSLGKLSREFSFFGIIVMGLPCCRVIIVLFQVLCGWMGDSREMRTYQST